MIKEVMCPICQGYGFNSKYNENSIWSEKCQNCDGTGIVKAPMTNADCIRAMSDEELAIWLAEWSFCADACPASTNEVEEAIGYHCPSNCKEQALTWLQQPAEEETVT